MKFDEIAVALKYDFISDSDVPKILASGRGFIAQKILETAKKHNIPVEENRPLSEALAKVPAGSEIPMELWSAVAEILAQIYLLESRGGGKNP
ncbi:MAG: hypothetical protein GX221_08280 [Candidatus Riflebacteria bacterium]|nr:hypothetical protein [Candidatus Riflebacteria bacterium]